VSTPDRVALAVKGAARVNPQFVRLDRVELCYDVRGPADGRPLLLIMGLDGPMIWWLEELCDKFIERDFRVIRYDNRDCGRTRWVGRPPRFRLLRTLLQRRGPYAIEDMAADAAGLLRHLEIDRAHVLGGSMGGMIAQALAIREPGRVLSLTSIASTPGGSAGGRPKLSIARLLLQGAPQEDDEAYVEHELRLWREMSGSGFKFDEQRLRRLAEDTWMWAPISRAASRRQLGAILLARDRTKELAGVRAPALVVHGTEDPVIRESGGAATAAAIPGAELIPIPGMGHEFPPEVWDRAVDAVDRIARRAETGAGSPVAPA
jgi:pimeloyl-ACP methyl ester carboxylesterase